ncbi:MAG TPA: TauD/TfdA family dioxygenase [Burkholderiales bacterium]|jgi:taurine dioxygenase|nr:TauD/TfdA family dioxygenase [Burkholderiales bacterium]
MTFGNGLQIHLLCGAGGAEISGIDASRPLSQDTVAGLRRALAEHCVIFLRDQQLTPEQQETFARHFGPLAPTPFIQPLEGHPDMMRIVREPDEKKKLNFGGRWHSDMTFSAEPVLGTCLYARESPEVGGDTIWSNQMLAFEALSPGMRAMLERLTVLHSAKRSYGPQGTYADDDLKSMRIQASEAALKEQPHPCIRTHPETGRSILFINWVYAIRFQDMTEEESAPLLEYLNRHCQRPEFQIRFRWRKGSLALWDNRSTQHIAVNDYAGYRRVMDRVTIAGDRPYFRGNQ